MKDLTRDLNLVKRCENAYDIYQKSVSSLSYAPDNFVVYKNGRRIPNIQPFDTVDAAEDYVNSVNEAAKELYVLLEAEVA